jgi:hypothetical protein
MSVTFTLLPKVVGLGGGSRVPSWPASIVLSRQVSMVCTYESAVARKIPEDHAPGSLNPRPRCSWR